MSASRWTRVSNGCLMACAVSAAVQVLCTAAGAPPERWTVTVLARTVIVLATWCTGLNLLLSAGRAGLERRREALDERAAGLSRRERDLAHGEIAAFWRDDWTGGDVPRQRQAGEQ